MTHKDFELIARAVRMARPIGAPNESAILRGAHDGVNNVAIALADELAATNPRFDRGRFLKACGVE